MPVHPRPFRRCPDVSCLLRTSRSISRMVSLTHRIHVWFMLTLGVNATMYIHSTMEPLGYCVWCWARAWKLGYELDTCAPGDSIRSARQMGIFKQGLLGNFKPLVLKERQKTPLFIFLATAFKKKNFAARNWLVFSHLVCTFWIGWIWWNTLLMRRCHMVANVDWINGHDGGILEANRKPISRVFGSARAWLLSCWNCLHFHTKCVWHRVQLLHMNA